VRGIAPGLAVQQRFDRLLQYTPGFGDAETLIVAQPAPALEAEQHVERLDQDDVTGDIPGQYFQQAVSQQLHQMGMRLPQERGAVALNLSGEQERLHLLEPPRPTVDQFQDLPAPVGGLKRQSNAGFHRRGDAAAHLAVERIHIAEMTEHRPPADPGDLRDLVGDIRKKLEGFAADDLVSIEFLRVYTGPPLPEGKKSVSFRLTVGAHGRTLSSDEAGATRSRIIEAMQALGYELRL